MAGVSAGDRPLRTRELVLGDEAQPPDPPRQGLQPARRSQRRDRAPAASLPRRGAQRSREPTFFFLLRLRSRARERRRAKPRTGQTPQRPCRGPPAAACARVRGGRAAPTTRRPRSRSRPLPPSAPPPPARTKPSPRRGPRRTRPRAPRLTRLPAGLSSGRGRREPGVPVLHHAPPPPCHRQPRRRPIEPHARGGGLRTVGRAVTGRV